MFLMVPRKDELCLASGSGRCWRWCSLLDDDAIDDGGEKTHSNQTQHSPYNTCHGCHGHSSPLHHALLGA